jgi:FemAB-related protein (PEP-CTERM system-associated)
VNAPLRVAAAGPDEREMWERFREGRPDGEVGHAWAVLELIAHVFRVELVRLVALRGGACVGLLPLVVQRSLLGRYLTSVPYLNYAGVLGDDPEARHSLAREALTLAGRVGADRLELRGRHGQDLPIDVWPGKASYALDLADAATTWEALGAKVRAQVRRPSKAGYGVRLGGREERAGFFRLLARRWHELGSPVLPERFFAGLEAALGDRMEYVSIVAPRGEIAAAGVVVANGERVEIPWAASATEHNPQGVNMLLYWSAIERAAARGAKRFDFGRSTPGSGNARFKLQWGAREEPLAWNVSASSSKGRAGERGASGRGLAAALWRCLPAPFAERLGPSLAARIPL